MSLRERLESGERLVGTVLTIADPTLAELVGRSCDLVWIDLEHGAIGVRDVPGLAMAARGAGCAALVRLPRADSELLPALLDAGIDGIVAPHVDTAEAARALVGRLHHPPAGTRGFAHRRWNCWGAGAADLPVCMVQIESRRAVEQITEIASVAGVDAIAVGPADLALDLGVPPALDGSHLQAAVRAVIAAARTAGVPAGIAAGGDAERIAKVVERRASFVVHSADVRLYAGAVARDERDAIGAQERRMKPLRIGLLSTARINEQIVAASRSSARAVVVAVASRDLGRARAYSQAHRLERAHGGYDELLADPDVDAVYVSLPNSLHAEWCVRALDAGKHVLCEKPLSRRAADVNAAFDVAQRAGLRLQEAFMFRHHAQTARLVQLVRGGVIGDLAFVRASFSFELAGASDPRARRDLDGGALMDVGCYCVSAARLLAGEPRRVFGERVLGGDGVDMRFTGTLRFAGGVLAQFDCAMDQPRRDALEVVGTQGVIALDDPWHCRLPAFRLERPYVVEEVPFARRNPYRLELEAFCDGVRDGADLESDRAEAVAQARTVEALLESAEGGNPIDISDSPDEGGT